MSAITHLAILLGQVIQKRAEVPHAVLAADFMHGRAQDREALAAYEAALSQLKTEGLVQETKGRQLRWVGPGARPERWRGLGPN